MVAANPVFPDLLPAVDYPGSVARIRWRDVLPRAGLAWDARSDGSLRLTTTYSAYGTALSAGDLAFTITATLPPGTYDLVVYAHSAALNAFAGAETVRVIVR